MNDTLTIYNERVDDLPFLYHQLEEMQIRELIDTHITLHGNWQGLSVGWVSVFWLMYILSQSDHRLYYVETWVSKHHQTLEILSGQSFRSCELSDDRLAIVLRFLSDSEFWHCFESALGRSLVRTYRLEACVVRHDSTTVSSYGLVDEDGLLQLGLSKDHRPDLGQLKVMMSSLDPFSLPLSVAVVSGNRADDPLYLPAISRVRETLGSGLLHVGDTKMAARQTRATIARDGDFYLCPLPKLQRAELSVYLDPVDQEDVVLQPIYRTYADGKSRHIGDGYIRSVEQSADLDGQRITWREQQFVMQSLSYAKSQQQNLQKRLKKTLSELNDILLPRQGKTLPKTLQSLKQKAETILKRHKTTGLFQIEYSQSTRKRHIRAYKDRPARTLDETLLQLSATIDKDAVDKAHFQLGWRVYATNAEELTLQEGALIYRDEFQIEQTIGRLKGQPLSVKPMYLQRDDHRIGLIRLLSIALRVLALVEFVIRSQLKKHNTQLNGLYGRGKTQKPTTERVLKTFEHITLTVIITPKKKIKRITPLTHIQRTILNLLNFNEFIYNQFNDP